MYILSVIVFFIMANSGPGDSLLNLAMLSGKLMKFKCVYEATLSKKKTIKNLSIPLNSSHLFCASQVIYFQFFMLLVMKLYLWKFFN